jgi:hypothetical protein
LRDVLAEINAGFRMFHHLSSIAVTLDGDRATATSYVMAPIAAAGEGPMDVLFTVGAVYHDKIVRTPEGWRIAERIEEQRFILPGAHPA